jgi:hypothetical protein
MRGRMSTRLAAATAAVTDRFVASANMKVGTYTIANATPAVPGARKVTVTHTAVTGNDTLGTLAVVGKDLLGNTITETITPLAGTIATGNLWFASVTSVTGAGWVINTGNDTIVVGHTAAAILAEGGGSLAAIAINTTAAGAITIADSTGTLAVLAASIAVGLYEYEIPFSGYLSVTLAAASDVTVIHTGSVPTVYALA